MAAWFSVSVGVGAIKRMLRGNGEVVCLVVWERKRCVGSWCLSVGHGPKDHVFGVVG